MKKQYKIGDRLTHRRTDLIACAEEEQGSCLGCHYLHTGVCPHNDTDDLACNDVIYKKVTLLDKLKTIFGLDTPELIDSTIPASDELFPLREEPVNPVLVVTLQEVTQDLLLFRVLLTRDVVETGWSAIKNATLKILKKSDTPNNECATAINKMFGSTHSADAVRRQWNRIKTE